MNDYDTYHYSVTIETNDEVILHCLRAISQYAQQEGYKQITWGGTSKKNWLHNHNRVTFHFSRPEYRNTFRNEASRLMPRMLWQVVSESDDDVATRQRY